MSFHILLYIEIKRDVRHPWQCKGCDDDSYQGTSSDAEDVALISCHDADYNDHQACATIIMVVVIAEDAAIVIMTAVSDAKDSTMIVIILVIFIMI